LNPARLSALRSDREAVTVTDPWSTSTIAAPVFATAERWACVRTSSTR
jgi:hypothetical protein